MVALAERGALPAVSLTESTAFIFENGNLQGGVAKADHAALLPSYLVLANFANMPDAGGGTKRTRNDGAQTHARTFLSRSYRFYL